MHVRNILIFLVPFAYAQSLNTAGSDPANAPGDWTYKCGGDVLVDDFSVDRTWDAPNGEHKHLSALEGDWKMVGEGSFHIDTSQKALVITPKKAATAAETQNYFFTQFTSQKKNFDKACVNLSPFDAIEFTAIAPEGFDFQLTFTQRQTGNCEIRTTDSTYHSFSQYYKTPGKEQKIRLPFSDFAQNTNGGNFDFAWTKDFTLVNLKGKNEGDSVIIKNFWLKGRSCGNGEQGPAGATTTTTTVPPTTNTTPTVPTTPDQTSSTTTVPTTPDETTTTSTSTPTTTRPIADKDSGASPSKGGVIGLALGLAGLAFGAIGL